MIETQSVTGEKEEKISYTDKDGKGVTVSLKEETVADEFSGGENNICIVRISDSEKSREVEIADWLMSDVRGAIRQIIKDRMSVDDAGKKIETDIRDNTLLYGPLG